MWFKVILVVLPIFLIFPLFFFYLSNNSFLVFLLVLSLERLIKVFNFFLCLNATIKLFLFFLSHVLDSRDVLEESLSCLFTDITCNQMILVTHVHSMVVNSEWPLRSHELGYCCVVRMWNGFSIQCVFNYPSYLLRVLTGTAQLPISRWWENLSRCVRSISWCWSQVCFSSLLVATLRSGINLYPKMILVLICNCFLLIEQLLISCFLLLGDSKLWETHWSLFKSWREGVSLISTYLGKFDEILAIFCLCCCFD